MTSEQLRQRVEQALLGFLEGRRPVLRGVSDEVLPVLDALVAFLLERGKRLRPAFCYWGWRGTGAADGEAIIVAAACLELLHGCALIHDDVMDGSDTRRGQPAVHRRFAATHRGEGWTGSPESFGLSAAILLGDLCLIWSEQMLSASGLPAESLERGRGLYDAMRVELMAGQYLDLLEQALGARSTMDRALRVARFKTGAYTVERPLHLGAVLAGADSELLACYSGYGVPLGEAFQLRDDVLGVFGDPEVTGKPAGDDLREGKRTALVAAALARASQHDAALVRRHLGDPHLGTDGVVVLREVIESTGALEEVERLIAARTAQALAALRAGRVAQPARQVLEELAVAATSRVG